MTPRIDVQWLLSAICCLSSDAPLIWTDSELAVGRPIVVGGRHARNHSTGFTPTLAAYCQAGR